MAAFVGNHACVAVINNFIPKEDVWYFTRYVQSFKEELGVRGMGGKVREIGCKVREEGLRS